MVNIRKMINRIVVNARNCSTLIFGFGKLDNCSPWYTYPAIEFLNQLDFSHCTILEYGSGNSTKFWAERCKQLVSVEDNQDWYNLVKQNLPDNVKYIFANNKQEYVNSAYDVYPEYDIIIIDGEYRNECARAALSHLSHGGFIILDNSDWFEKTSSLLRQNLIEIDFSGFSAINDYTLTTSFYLSRDINFIPKGDRQPIHGVGSAKLNEEILT